MKEGFLSIAKFARKIGVSDAAIYNWIALNAIPFRIDPDTNAKIIPEHEAMESPKVKAALDRRAKREYWRGKDNPQIPIIAPKAEPPAIIPSLVNRQNDPGQEEKLFLIARQQAAGFIARARNCRADARHEAEAELLWMAVECFGFKP